MRTDIDQAIVERMVALVRGMAVDVAIESVCGISRAVQEARAIADLLPPPVDPLLIEAREIVVSVCGDAMWSQAWRKRVLNGEEDRSVRVTIALAALRKARGEGVK